MSEWKLVDVEGIGSGYACLTLDGVSTTKSRNLIQADRGAGGDGLGFSDLGTLLIDYADRDIAGVVGITGDQGGIREDVVGRSDVHIISGVEFCSARPIDTRGDTYVKISTQLPAGARKSTFILTPQRGGGVKVLLRYFLTRK